ncbi:hypothetical protein [Dactylosporangium sp. NPDC051541]|uniref:hypothetical protein n=1 Tax=Dactylosporangium sp. NPDC051541 TaxID=3363977 RepID=UPI00379E044F
MTGPLFGGSPGDLLAEVDRGLSRRFAGASAPQPARGAFVAGALRRGTGGVLAPRGAGGADGRAEAVA